MASFDVTVKFDDLAPVAGQDWLVSGEACLDCEVVDGELTWLALSITLETGLALLCAGGEVDDVTTADMVPTTYGPASQGGMWRLLSAALEREYGDHIHRHAAEVAEERGERLYGYADWVAEHSLSYAH